MDTDRDLNLEKQIDAYVKGRLSEDQVKDLWIELFKRPKYIDLLETELSVKLIIEEQLEAERAEPQAISAAGERESTGSAFMRSWKWLATAASVAILVIAINFLELDHDQPIQQLTLGEINLVENLASPEVMRSQDVESTALDSLLNLGFKAAISGDKVKALEIYNEVIRDYETDPKAAMAHLNVGIINYNAQDYEKAVTSFTDAVERVTDDRVLEEKAYWYLGNAYVNMGQLDKARTAIENVHAFEGIYQKPASRLLEKIDEELELSGQGSFEQQSEEE